MTTQTLQQFLESENLFDTEFTTVNDILKHFETADQEIGYLISPTEFLTDYDYCFINEMKKEDIENLKGDFKLIEHDNTYNFGGFAKNEIHYLIFTEQNSDTAYLMLSFHIGEDIRIGYTKYLLFIGSNVDWLRSLLNQIRPIRTIEYNNKVYSFEGSLTGMDLDLVCLTTDDFIPNVYIDDLNNEKEFIEYIKAKGI